jgi:hypothetical protein
MRHCILFRISNRNYPGSVSAEAKNSGSGSTTLVTPQFIFLGADYGPCPEWDTKIPRRWYNAQDLQSQLHERKCFTSLWRSTVPIPIGCSIAILLFSVYFLSTSIWTGHFNLVFKVDFNRRSIKKDRIGSSGVRKQNIPVEMLLSEVSVPGTHHRKKESVLRIHAIFGWIRIRIRGSMPLTNGSGSGSCYVRQCPSRRKKIFFCL